MFGLTDPIKYQCWCPNLEVISFNLSHRLSQLLFNYYNKLRFIRWCGFILWRDGLRFKNLVNDQVFRIGLEIIFTLEIHSFELIMNNLPVLLYKRRIRETRVRQPKVYRLQSDVLGVHEPFSLHWIAKRIFQEPLDRATIACERIKHLVKYSH